MTETRDKIVIESTTQGVDQSTDKLRGLANAYDGVAVASEKTEKSTVSIENKFASLERRFQTTAGQQAQFEKIQNQVNLAVKQNPELQDRANSVLAAAEAKYLGAGAAVKALAAAHTGLDAQGQAALHTIRSVVEQLALGIPPTQALTGQLNHLTFAATGEGGLAGAFKQVGGLVGGLITPTNAAIAVTVALTAAAAALAVQYDKVQVSSQRALIGAGQRTGTTVSDLNTFTEQNSGLAGTGLSAKEARGLGEDFTKTGEIVISRLHGMSDAVVGFANQTGKSIDEAKKDLVGFAIDPQKGIEELAKTFGSFDIATRKAVEALVQADDKTGAFQIVIDALGEKSKKAAENMGVFEKATRAVVNVLASETVKPKGLEAGLAGANANVAAAQGALSDAGRQGAPSPVLEALAENLAKARKEAEQFQAAMDKVNTQKADAELNKLSTDADNVAKAIIPQIAQIEQLKIKLEELERVKAAGATSKYGAEVDNAAAVKIRNDIAATEELQAATARYNQQVAAISQEWGHVGQSVALQLQSMQNALPVAQAWTNAGKMLAQEQATYNDLIDNGKTAEEASALAAKGFELSKAAAVASAKKLVQASEDNLDKIRAEGTGMEGVVDSAIAYRDAIQSGATAMQANVIAANTLQASLMKAAQAQTQLDNQTAAYNAKLEQAARASGASEFGGRGNAFGDHSGNQYTSVIDPLGLGQDIYNAPYKIDVGKLSDQAFATGGIDAARSAITGASNTTGATALLHFMADGLGYNVNQLFGPERSTIEDKISNYDQLTQLQNAQTSDKGTQVSNLQAEMDWLQTLPETISRDLKIVSLQQSIDALKNATDANTAATSATLNPLYSQGHGALAIGYYKAAGGLDMMAHGPTSGDQIPFHAMVNGGERITITPPGRSGNDNSRQVINNNNFVFNNATTSNARRSFRQFSQGFGQVAAAGS